MERRLGRGLGSLLGTPSVASDKPDANISVSHSRGEPATDEIALERIRPNPFQPRKEFAEAALDELAQSIKAHGLLQPLVVRPVPGGFELIAGERRWRACKRLGKQSVPVVVRQVDDAQMLELALVENVQRQDLNAIERAEGYQRMIEQLHLTQDQVAGKVGLQRSTIANHVRLLELPAVVQQGLAQGLVSMGQARAMLGLADPQKQLALMERMVREDLSVRQVEQFVREAVKTSAPTSSVQSDVKLVPVAPWVRDLEARMREHLGTKVRIQNSPGYRGQIVIEYFQREDLERVMEILAPKGKL